MFDFTWQEERKIIEMYKLDTCADVNRVMKIESILNDQARWNLENIAEYNELKRFQLYTMQVILATHASLRGYSIEINLHKIKKIK